MPNMAVRYGSSVGWRSRSRSVCEGIKNSTYGKDTEAEKTKVIFVPLQQLVFNPRRSERYHKLRHDDATPVHEPAQLLSGLPFDSISPSWGNIAALAK